MALLCLATNVLESWITSLTLLRNACCHHSSVWNKVSSIMLVSPRRIAHSTNRPTSYTFG
ncbi:Abi family protein [Hallella multisaccharivorax]|uniref:Abi family protein n=1 Tax=Hallella multisaccharivorax TaxID=310514 RepID=UPI001CC55072|nr:Abi family protein [Hallella multisaccharivorax]